MTVLILGRTASPVATITQRKVAPIGAHVRSPRPSGLFVPGRRGGVRELDGPSHTLAVVLKPKWKVRWVVTERSRTPGWGPPFRTHQVGNPTEWFTPTDLLAPHLRPSTTNGARKYRLTVGKSYCTEQDAEVVSLSTDIAAKR